eukprot:21212-Heterococcus_DN1.PRE.1
MRGQHVRGSVLKAAVAKAAKEEDCHAEPSKLPARHFCSVCGYFSKYTCTRCGMRLCRAKCQTQHRETRCLKFSA